MALQVFNIGTNEDGTPRFHYYCPDGHLVLTGPNTAGEVKTADGTSYDVTPLVIEVDSHEHAVDVAAHLSGVSKREVVMNGPIQKKKV